MKTLITTFALFSATLFVANAQCPNPLLDTNNIISTTARVGRSTDNSYVIARVCKGQTAKFWTNYSTQTSQFSVMAWQVLDGQNQLLFSATSDTLTLQNISATKELTIKLFGTVSGVTGLCYEYRMKYEVLETSTNVSTTNLNGTLVVSNIPTHYSVNIRSIPNGADFSNGYLYDNGSLIFQLPNGNYQLMYTFQDHVWMNSPVCMDQLLFDTITITNSNVAVSYIEDDASVKVYPNPASDHFVVEADNEIKSITLFNSVGQTILKQAYPTVGKQISVADLPGGLYVILIETDKRLVRKQLVKH